MCSLPMTSVRTGRAFFGRGGGVVFDVLACFFGRRDLGLGDDLRVLRMSSAFYRGTDKRS